MIIEAINTIIKTNFYKSSQNIYFVLNIYFSTVCLHFSTMKMVGISFILKLNSHHKQQLFSLDVT